MVDGTDIHAEAYGGDHCDHLLLAHEYGDGDIHLDMGVLRRRAGKGNSQGNLEIGHVRKKFKAGGFIRHWQMRTIVHIP